MWACVLDTQPSNLSVEGIFLVDVWVLFQINIDVTKVLGLYGENQGLEGEQDEYKLQFLNFTQWPRIYIFPKALTSHENFQSQEL